MSFYQELIAKIKSRDNEAFDLLYQKTKYMVFSIIYGIVGNKDTAEDLLQDTYMKMLEKLDSYNPNCPFPTWLLTIAKHLAIDHVRKEKNHFSIDPYTQEYLLPREANRMYHRLESEEYLSVLTEEERTIVLMKVVGELKHHEIARIVDKPTGTVMWIYNKAIQKMQKKGGAI